MPKPCEHEGWVKLEMEDVIEVGDVIVGGFARNLDEASRCPGNIFNSSDGYTGRRVLDCYGFGPKIYRRGVCGPRLPRRLKMSPLHS